MLMYNFYTPEILFTRPRHWCQSKDAGFRKMNTTSKGKECAKFNFHQYYRAA